MRFDFVERKGYKYRPVIVLDVAGDIALTAAMVTGVETRLSFPHDYVLADWQKEGLTKPSLVRLDKRRLDTFSQRWNCRGDRRTQPERQNRTAGHS